jgi:hypothetical protein
VAVARKLAVIMHGMWLDGSEFRFAASDQPAGKERNPAPAAPATSERCDNRLTPRRVQRIAPPTGGGLLGESKRMRRARYLAGDDASSKAESPLVRMWPRDPDADMCGIEHGRLHGITKCNALPSAKLVASLRLGVQSTTGDHHDQQAKKASKRAECAEGRSGARLRRQDKRGSALVR